MKGGPAFPVPYHPQEGVNHSNSEGMTLRDYFAAHCPQAEVVSRVPGTMGDIADRCVELGWISEAARRLASYCYTPAHVARLRTLARYEYADEMIAARDA